MLKKTTHTWLKEVSSNVMKQGVKDANEAWQRYFKDLAEKPKFKSKHRSTPRFYVNYESLKKTQNGFQGEKLGIVKTAEPLPARYNSIKNYIKIHKKESAMIAIIVSEDKMVNVISPLAPETLEESE